MASCLLKIDSGLHRVRGSFTRQGKLHFPVWYYMWMLKTLLSPWYDKFGECLENNLHIT